MNVSETFRSKTTQTQMNGIGKCRIIELVKFLLCILSSKPMVIDGYLKNIHKKLQAGHSNFNYYQIVTATNVMIWRNHYTTPHG